MTPQMQEAKISLLEREQYVVSNKPGEEDGKTVVLESNLKRFEEERRQFEKEKLKFLEDKRELDRLRLQRFERYKREIEAKRVGLKPNYDIDNPYDYMVARKVVIDYKMNDRLTASAADSGSDSEPDITVVENVPREEIKATESDAKVIETEAPAPPPDTIKSVDDSKAQSDGKELSNDTEKPVAVAAAPVKVEEANLEKVDTSNMKLWAFTKLLIRETRQVWGMHRRRHPNEWQGIKKDIGKCLSELVMFAMFCGCGGLVFRYIEGSYEIMNKTGVKRVKRDFIDQLWLSSHNLR